MDGDEREYILELLMREVPPHVGAGVHPARAEPTALTGKRKRNLGKKLRKKFKMARNTVGKEAKRERKAQGAGEERGQAAPAAAREPGAKNRDPGGKKQEDRGPSSAPKPTSGRECSGH